MVLVFGARVRQPGDDFIISLDKCGLEDKHTGDEVSDEKDDEAEEEQAVEGVRKLQELLLLAVLSFVLLGKL